MEQQILLAELAEDTLKGFSANQKFLLSKYFYDDIGSLIFQEIMQMPEYYLTDCELEIFSESNNEINDAILNDNTFFELIELGPGDGLKTKILLNSLSRSAVSFKYIPVDISAKANNDLVKNLSVEIPSLDVYAQNGDFFHVMKQKNGYSGIRKVVFFLGSNIGNFFEEELHRFLCQLSEFTHKGDKALIGFDLKKSPQTIMKAYNDSHGHTRNFNLNHLVRLNRELGADFNLDNFEHHVEYNPQTGAVKSYLLSKNKQKVHIEKLGEDFIFNEWEPIFMELSQKFDLETIESLAVNHGFEIEKHFTDKRNYFVDSLWTKL